MRFYLNNMLSIARSEIGHFGHADVTSIFKAGGWKALLPNALSDSQLLCTALGLHSFLYSDDLEEDHHEASPIVTMAILMLVSCVPEITASESPQKFGLSTLQQVMAMLSLNVDREIASRVLGVQSDETEEALTEVLRAIAVQTFEVA